MHTGDSASDGPDDRQSTTDDHHAISRRTVLRGAAAAAAVGTVLGFTSGGARADHAPPSDSAATTGTVTVFTRESPEISIDIEPDEEWPATVPYGGEEIEVCIEHTDDFDPATVDVGTLRFGPPRVVDEGGGARAVDDGRVEDADGDGDADLLVRFAADDAGFDSDDFAARLVGQTIYGTPISDHDFVVTSEDGSDDSEGGNDGNGSDSDKSDGNSTEGDTGTDGSDDSSGDDGTDESE